MFTYIFIFTLLAGSLASAMEPHFYVETFEPNQNVPNKQRLVDPDESLFVAASKGHVIRVNSLLEFHNANPNCVNPETGLSPLFIAITHGKNDVVKALLARGADPALALNVPFEKDGQSFTLKNVQPLAVARFFGNEEAIKLLKKN